MCMWSWAHQEVLDEALVSMQTRVMPHFRHVIVTSNALKQPHHPPAPLPACPWCLLRMFAVLQPLSFVAGEQVNVFGKKASDTAGGLFAGGSGPKPPPAISTAVIGMKPGGRVSMMSCSWQCGQLACSLWFGSPSVGKWHSSDAVGVHLQQRLVRGEWRWVQNPQTTVQLLPLNTRSVGA